MLYAPYHAVVRRIIRHAFANISAGKTQGFSRQFAPNAVFCFHGDHALGGELHGRPAIEAWFARIARLFPNFQLTPENIVVNGGPWDTTIATRFTARATLPGGDSYRNQGMQFARIRWGSIVEDRLYEDTAVLVDALQRIAQSGKTEALGPPIVPIPA